MKINCFIAVAAILAAQAVRPACADVPTTVDIKRAAPPDAYLAIYTHHNPERDYQREYVAAAWKTFQDEQIGQRLIEIVRSRVPEDKLTTAKSKLEELKAACEPIHLETLLGADEFVFAETMEGPFNQVVFAVRLKADDAAAWTLGATQSFELFSRWSEGKLTVQTSQVKDATITQLQLPKESPFQPAVAQLNDIVLLGSNPALLRRSLEQLQDQSAKSKFDDPRLQEALTHLPKPEDSLIFFDAQKLFQGIHGVGDFIRSHANNDPKAARVAHLLDRVIDNMAVLDYEAKVEYTEAGQNHTAAYGKLSDNFDSTVLGRALSQSKPFDDWQKWVPGDATAYSLTRGVSLHELYDGIVKIVREEFPESQPGFDKWAAVQEKIGVDVDRDILQSFSGERVSVTIPVAAADGSTKPATVTALKCENSDKVRELLGRAFDALNKIPAVQAQQLKLEDCKDLEGFQELHAAIFMMFGTQQQPVIGFRDGWMIIASSEAAAKKLLAVRSGQAESINAAQSFQKLGMDWKGPVSCVSFEDVGAGLRAAADGIDKIGAMAPMFLSMAGAHAKPEDLKPAQEMIGLLPSFAKVIRKFDFFEHSLSVTRAGPSPGTYLRQSVTEVRLPSAQKTSE